MKIVAKTYLFIFIQWHILPYVIDICREIDKKIFESWIIEYLIL